jgi:hypothetical protein
MTNEGEEDAATYKRKLGTTKKENGPKGDNIQWWKLCPSGIAFEGEGR